jgi:hypothetical protein
VNKWKKRYLDLERTRQAEAKECDDIITGLIDLAHDQGLVINQKDHALWDAISAYRARKWGEVALWNRLTHRQQIKGAYLSAALQRKTP